MIRRSALASDDPGRITEHVLAGVVDHIRKELREIEAEPGDLKEWIDVAILALDGAWRSGASPAEILAALVAKQDKNEARTWPGWRGADPDKAIEHDRTGEKPPEADDGLPWLVDDTATLRRVFTAMGQQFPVSNEIPDSHLIRYVRDAMAWILGPETRTAGADAVREAAEIANRQAARARNQLKSVLKALRDKYKECDKVNSELFDLREMYRMQEGTTGDSEGAR